MRDIPALMRRVVRLCLLAAACCAVQANAAALAGVRVGIYSDSRSTWRADVIPSLEQLVASCGHQVVALTPDDMTPERLKPSDLAMLIVCDAGRAPAGMAAGIADYLAKGGKVMMLGPPMLTVPMSRYRGKYCDRAELQAALSHDMKPAVLWNFESEELPAMTHGTNLPKSDSAATRIAGGAAGTTGAMQLDLRGVVSWDNFRLSVDGKDSPVAHAWTTFWAKGEASQGASQLMLEWDERDGSRWTCVVPLTDQWQFFALPPEAFSIWEADKTPSRGKAGDAFKPENAAYLTLGLALSHVSGLRRDATYRIAVDQIGTAPPPADLEDPGALFGKKFRPQPIEGLCPAYKFFPVTTSKQFRTVATQAIAETADLPVPKQVFAPHPRSDGTGFGKNRPWRFQPLLECVDEYGEHAGAAAALLLYGEDASKGGMVASIPIDDPAFFAASASQQWLGGVMKRMFDGVFFYEAGTQYYASFGNEKMPVGAVVSNRGRNRVSTVVRAVISDGKQQKLWEKAWNVDVPAGESRKVEADWAVAADVAEPCRVCLTLLRGGRVIDRLEHQVRVWRPKATPRFVTARDGLFYDGDAPWYAHGINYMPSSGIAVENGQYFEYWLDAQPYDQAIVERDLKRIKSLGGNMISAFVYHRSLASRNVLDLLMRCEDLGLKVNLSLRPGTPLDFQWDQMRELVVANRFAENDTIMAYDLAWEPLWNVRAARRQFDSLWQTWVEKRYGNIDAAEKAWGVPAPRENGSLAGPNDEQVSREGPWRAMVLDYRRFQNELLHERYSKARELMHSVDPNHLVSFRMTTAGDPTFPPALMPYDFAGLAGAVDFMAPEGYGRIGDWNRVRTGLFTVAYARAVAPALPVVWAEYGNSTWDQEKGCVNSDQVRVVELYYRDFLQMAYQSGSNGTIAWWYPGGYRCGERSDYGIIGPDGERRPQAKVFQEWAERMKTPRPLPKADVIIPIKLENDVDGVAGIYRRVEAEYWKAVDAGKTPGLKVVPADGTTPDREDRTAPTR